MNKLFFLSLFLLLTAACGDGLQPDTTVTAAQNDNPPISTEAGQPSLNTAAVEEATQPEPEYEGRSIDQIFPIIESHDFTEEDFNDKTYSIKAEEYEIRFKDFAPLTIEKDGKTLFRFKTRTPDDYHASHVGVSHLLGKDSKEIYVITGGPGGVCCTNYWIVDISAGRPRQIFRSEEFGGFRDWMEIFDADGDGIYEIMQWDSAFRYFMDDCGSCSPEPRATFKYDPKIGYRPAKGLRQDFLTSFSDHEKELAEDFETSKIQLDGKTVHDPQFYRDLNALIVNLIYYGDEKKAWRIFDKYYGKNESETRAAIKERLAGSKYYQALRLK